MLERQRRALFSRSTLTLFGCSALFVFGGCDSPKKSTPEIVPSEQLPAPVPTQSSRVSESEPPRTVPVAFVPSLPTPTDVLPPHIPPREVPQPRAPRVALEDIAKLNEQARTWLESIGLKYSADELKALKTLDLSAHGLTTLPWAALSSLPNLQDMNLQRNALSNLDLSQVTTAGFQSLQYVDLSCSQTPLPATVLSALGSTAPGLLALNIESTGTTNLPENYAGLFSRLVSFYAGNSTAPDQFCPSQNSFTPEIAGAIAPLSTLQWLTVANLDFSASTFALLTAESRLARLEKLDLHNNGFLDDSFLNSVAQLPSLQSLNLNFQKATANAEQNSHQISISGVEKLAQISTLKELNVAGSAEFSKYDLPAEALVPLAQISNLETLDLSYSLHSTSELGLKALSNLSHLQSLALAQRFTQTGSFFSAKYLPLLQGLRHLELVGYSFKDADLPFIGQLKNLESLTLGTTELGKKDGFEDLATLQKLETLDLAASPLGAQDFAPLQKLPALKNISLLSGTQKQFDQLPSLSHLEKMTFSSVWESDAELAFLKLMPNIREFSLGNAQETCVGIAWVTCLSNETLANLGSLQNLERLRLNGTAVTSAGLTPLSKLEHLEYLDLRNNTNIDERAIEVLGKLQSLRHLALTNTALNAAEILALPLHIPGLQTLVAGQLTASENADLQKHSRVRLTSETW